MQKGFAPDDPTIDYRASCSNCKFGGTTDAPDNPNGLDWAKKDLERQHTHHKRKCCGKLSVRPVRSQVSTPRA
ncbi:MAG: hypothetical protein ABIB97_01590 [Patescibacteria group bacterium]